MSELQEWQKKVYECAKEKGWWDPDPTRTFGTLSTLFVSEISEAFEEWRNGRDVTEVYENENNPGKPEGIPIEFVDVCIRILDWFGHHEIDLQKQLDILTTSESQEYGDQLFHWVNEGQSLNSRDDWMLRNPTFGDQCCDLMHLLSSRNLSQISEAFLRILGWFGKHEIDFEDLLNKKYQYNLIRSYRHGGKRV